VGRVVAGTFGGIGKFKLGNFARDMEAWLGNASCGLTGPPQGRKKGPEEEKHRGRISFAWFLEGRRDTHAAKRGGAVWMFKLHVVGLAKKIGSTAPEGMNYLKKREGIGINRKNSPTRGGCKQVLVPRRYGSRQHNPGSCLREKKILGNLSEMETLELRLGHESNTIRS